MSGLPAGWVATTLKEITVIMTGKLDANAANSAGRFPFFTCAETESRIDSYSFDTEAVLLAGNGFFNVKTYKGKFDAYQRTYVIEPILISTQFLFYLFLQLLPEIVSKSRGSTIKYLRIGDIQDIKFLFPPAAEQTRIVAKLDALLTELDAGVVQLKAAQKKLVQYRQSLLKAAVEGTLTAAWRAEQTLQQQTVRPEPVEGQLRTGGSTGSPRTDLNKETGEQLLARILTERRNRWQAKQLAKYATQGKPPPKDWQSKYPEPVKPDTIALPALPQGWVWASVDQLSEFVRNGLSRTPNTEARGFPIFKINAVRPMVVNFAAIKHIELDSSEASDYWVEEGDLLTTRYNGSVDLLGVFALVKTVETPTLYPDKLIRMKPLLGMALGAWMESCCNVGKSRSYIVSKVKTTAGQTGISGEDLKKMPVPLPPFAEQEVALASLKQLLFAAKELEIPTETALKQSAAQRKNILKAAFAGELVSQDPLDEPASALLARIKAQRAANLPSKLVKPRRKGAL
jgi:type I restriction enzyme, S subunit